MFLLCPATNFLENSKRIVIPPRPRGAVVGHPLSQCVDRMRHNLSNGHLPKQLLLNTIQGFVGRRKVWTENNNQTALFKLQSLRNSVDILFGVEQDATPPLEQTLPAVDGWRRGVVHGREVSFSF